MASAQESRGNSNQQEQQKEDQEFDDVDSFQCVEELTNAGIKMAEINKLKEANLATVGAVLATPTKAR
ncbi:unnamed protein product [Ectocarpus sp. 12 AP-2014]